MPVEVEPVIVEQAHGTLLDGLASARVSALHAAVHARLALLVEEAAHLRLLREPHARSRIREFASDPARVVAAPLEHGQASGEVVGVLVEEDVLRRQVPRWVLPSNSHSQHGLSAAHGRFHDDVSDAVSERRVDRLDDVRLPPAELLHREKLEHVLAEVDGPPANLLHVTPQTVRVQ